MKKISVFIALILLFADIYSQTRELDSLKSLLKKEMPDSSQLSILTKILDLRAGDDPVYYRTMMNLAQKNINRSKPGSPELKLYKSYLSEAYFYEGYFYFVKMDLKKAIKSYEKALAISKELNEQSDVATCQTEIAQLYNLQEDYKKATEYLYGALDTFQALNDQKNIGLIYYSISLIYNRQKNYGQTIALAEKSFEAYKLCKDGEGMLRALSKIANVYTEQQDTSKSNAYILKTEAVINGMSAIEKERAPLAVNYALAKLNSVKGNYRLAIDYLNKILVMVKGKGVTTQLSTVYYSLSSVYRLMHQYQKAIDYSEKALAIEKELREDFGQYRSYKTLYGLYKQVGNDKKALEMYEQLVIMNDSIENKKDEKKVIELSLKHEFEKKALLAKIDHEKKISELNLQAGRKNTILLSLGGSLLLLTAGVCFLYYYYRQKSIIQDQKNNLLKQHALSLQMNPHFIFNSLSSIQGYVLAEDSLKAAKYLSRFSRLIRGSLENSRKEFITLEEEIESLTLYVELESLRMKNELSFHVNLNGLPAKEICIPPMLIQPHIENAIKHGLRQDIDSSGTVNISFTMKENLLYCSVDDNGVGINQTLAVEKRHKSTGTNVTRARLELLCSSFKIPFFFSVSDKQELGRVETGTIVEFLVPHSS